jgi:ABC-type hemin transport system substrate-binding protein
VVVIGTLALFLTVFALLVFQLRNGRDPALAGQATASAAAPPAKRVLVRKVIVTRVVVHLPEEETVVPSVQTSTVPAPASAPAAAPAPVPAPAPAPLTSRSS